MAATKRYMNITGLTFTPTSGVATPITGVTNMTYDRGGQVETFSGDGDRYNTTVVNNFNEPTISITAADLGALGSFANGTRGVLTWTHNDAKNGAVTGGGAIIYTAATAILQNVSNPMQHKQITSGTANFVVESSDGQTNPVSAAAA